MTVETEAGEEEAFTYFLVTIRMIIRMIIVIRMIIRMIIMIRMIVRMMFRLGDDDDNDDDNDDDGDDAGEASRRGPETERGLPRCHCQVGKRFKNYILI